MEHVDVLNALSAKWRREASDAYRDGYSAVSLALEVAANELETAIAVLRAQGEAESMWMFKQPSGYWSQFHDEAHRLEMMKTEPEAVRLFTTMRPQGAVVNDAMVERARAAYKATIRYSTGDYPEGPIRSVADMNRNDDDAWRVALVAAIWGKS